MSPYIELKHWQSGATRYQWLLALFVLISFPVISTAQSSEQAARQGQLTLGPESTHQLSGGQAHSYLVTLVQGQYLEAVVEQRGIDVIVLVVGPDRKKVIEVDNPNGTQGPEPIYMIADVAGDYWIEVRSLEKNAAAGNYAIQIKELRAYTETDRLRCSALKAYGEASQLRLVGTLEAIRQAVAKYEESLPAWQALKDLKKESETLSSLGFLSYNYLGETLKARAYHERELPLQRALGNQFAEAIALNNLGHIYASLGEMPKALEAYGQSLALHRAGGRRQNEGTVLDHLGQAYNKMGQLQRSLECQQQALAIFRDLRQPRNEAVALQSISVTFLMLGEYENALSYGQQSLALIRTVKDQLQEAIFLNNAGDTYLKLGDLRQALDYYQQAYALHLKSGNRQLQAYSLTSLGAVLSDLAEYPQALDFLQQSIAIHRANGSLRGEAHALFALGVLYQRTSQPQLAKASFEAALALSKAVEAPQLESNVYYALSRLTQLQGDLSGARQLSERALDLVESLRAAVAGEQSRTAFLASNQILYEHQINLLMEINRAQPDQHANVDALTVSERARARSLLDLLSETRTDIRQGVNTTLLAREQALQHQLQARAAAQTRLLNGRHTDAEAATLAQDIAALVLQLQEAQTQIRVSSPRYAALAKPQPANVADIQKLLDGDTLLLEYALGEKRSFLWAVTPSAVTSYALAPRAEIETAVRYVYALMAARPQRGAPLDLQLQTQSAALSQLLLGPAAAQLGKKRLVIVAAGWLAYLPFASLPEPKIKTQPTVPLIAQHEIVSLPSASVLAIIRRETADRLPAAKAVAVLADPVFETNDPRVTLAQAAPANPPLPNLTNAALARSIKASHHTTNPTNNRSGLTRLAFSRQEAEAIFAVAPREATLKVTDFDASRAAALSEQLGQYRVLHFATHGLLNNEQPELSGLVFSLVDKQGNPQDGFLRLHEVFNLKLNADLVVLSACETGLGKEIKGEGLIGLTRGFMYAGAPRVVASLWNVDDLATAELMKLFYQGMLKEGLRPAAALRAAQTELAKQKRWTAPYFWAGFILQGEWK